MVNADQAQQLFGAQIVDADGESVGRVKDVYLSDRTGEVSWVAVTTGWFGHGESLLPLERADTNNGQIRVPFDKSTIKNAPRYESGVPLTPQDEDALYRHYDLPTGRDRLRKHEITEQQTFTVPVSHEVARLEREPIDDRDREKMSSVVELKEEEIEIVLHAERPVVSTENVPMERDGPPHPN
jgi:sporulation protein YlmC with PRC-barrel domain